mgnify:CR=1 FL=1
MPTYITFDTSTGEPTGCYRQDVLPEHLSAHVVVTDEQAPGWVNLWVNPATGSLTAPPARPPLPPVVPAAVSMRQARLALLQAGKLGEVNALIAGLPGPSGDAARIEWEFSNEVRRQQPLVLQLGPGIGLDAAGLDQLFIVAQGL